MSLATTRIRTETEMLHRCCVSMLLIFAAHLFAGQDAQKPGVAPLTQDERSTEWLLAIEKLRTLPRPGDIQNAGILASIGDVIETTPDQKAAIKTAMKAFDAAMVQKAAQWESDMKAARAEFETKIVAALPEARRDAAKKALEYSHVQWVAPFDFEVRLRAEFIQKKEKSEDKTIPQEELDAYRKEFSTWLKTQRLKAQEHNAEVTKNIKALLDPKEAERLNDFDKNKEVPPPPPKKK